MMRPLVSNSPLKFHRGVSPVTSGGGLSSGTVDGRISISSRSARSRPSLMPSASRMRSVTLLILRFLPIALPRWSPPTSGRMDCHTAGDLIPACTMLHGNGSVMSAADARFVTSGMQAPSPSNDTVCPSHAVGIDAANMVVTVMRQPFAATVNCSGDVENGAMIVASTNVELTYCVICAMPFSATGYDRPSSPICVDCQS